MLTLQCAPLSALHRPPRHCLPPHAQERRTEVSALRGELLLRPAPHSQRVFLGADPCLPRAPQAHPAQVASHQGISDQGHRWPRHRHPTHQES